MAYRLQLTTDTLIHPVFHVSLLKKSIGGQPASSNLPSLPKGSEQAVEPEAILERRVVQQGGVPLIQVLVKWQGNTTGGNTWEYLPELLKKFPRAVSLLNLP